MSDTIAAPPGWYFVRVTPGESHLQRYAVAAWRVASGESALPLLAKPGEPGLVPPSTEDVVALVGLVPPDRDYQAYFGTEDVQEAHRRLHAFHQSGGAQRAPGGAGGGQATVAEVQMPGVGPVPVRNAAPPGQQPGEWSQRTWGSGGPQTPRLGGSGG